MFLAQKFADKLSCKNLKYLYVNNSNYRHFISSFINDIWRFVKYSMHKLLKCRAGQSTQQKYLKYQVLNYSLVTI